MSAPAPHRGSCLCGQVRFAVTGPMRPVVACHCLQCRKTSGHFVAATAAPWAAITLEGDVTWYASSPASRRGFCATCGSSLFWEGSDKDQVSIHAGSLDGATDLTLVGHIFCRDKGDYYDLNDALPKAPQGGLPESAKDDQ